MLGFRARASGRQPIRVDQEEIAEAHWFSRDELRASMAAGEIRLPPPVSIALPDHRILVRGGATRPVVTRTVTRSVVTGIVVIRSVVIRTRRVIRSVVIRSAVTAP